MRECGIWLTSFRAAKLVFTAVLESVSIPLVNRPNLQFFRSGRRKKEVDYAVSDFTKTQEPPGFLIGGFDRVLECRCYSDTQPLTHPKTTTVSVIHQSQTRRASTSTIPQVCQKAWKTGGNGSGGGFDDSSVSFYPHIKTGLVLTQTNNFRDNLKTRSATRTPYASRKTNRAACGLPGKALLRHLLSASRHLLL
jgi:hypothetical protein